MAIIMLVPLRGSPDTNVVNVCANEFTLRQSQVANLSQIRDQLYYGRSSVRQVKLRKSGLLDS